MLSILIWLPAATALIGALLGGRGRRGGAGPPAPAQNPPVEPAASLPPGPTENPPPGPAEPASVEPAASLPPGPTENPPPGRAGRPSWAGVLVAVGSLACLGMAVALIADYGGGRTGLTNVTDIVWIPALGIHYKLGVDGLNLFLVGLAALLFAVSVVAANLRTWAKPNLFFFHLGLAESAVLGALLAQDLALFVAFFDLMLIPFYFLVGVWGSGDRVRATTKLVIYTLVGSLLMLAAAIATAVLSAQAAHHGLTFVLSDLRRSPVPTGSADWIFLFFAAAFLVKMPAFPLHGWMPDGYRAMPIEALMVFSGVLSKVGAYGFLRIVLPLFPGASAHFQTLLLLIGLASVLYGSAMAFTQTNARLIAGYSSVAQLGFITLGIFSLTPQGAQGAVLQMVNHGLVVAPLFFIIALLAERAGGSEDIRDMGGIGMRAPILAGTFLVITMAALAIPGSGNFVGEFMILLGVFNTKIVISLVAFTGVVMAAVYMLRVYIRSVHNRTGPHVVSSELRPLDGLVLAPLVAAIVFFGLYPQFELHRAQRSVVGSITAAQAAAVPRVAAAPTGGLTAVRGAAAGPSAPGGSAAFGWTAYAPVPAVVGGRRPPTAAVRTRENQVTVTVR